MTSLHKLIAIVVIWIAVVVLAFYLLGFSMLNWLSNTGTIVLVAVLVGAAALSTWWVTRARA